MAAPTSTAVVTTTQLASLYTDIRVVVKAVGVYCKNIDKASKIRNITTKGLIRLVKLINAAFDRMTKKYFKRRDKFLKALNDSRTPPALKKVLKKLISIFSRVIIKNRQLKQKIQGFVVDGNVKIEDIIKVAKEICKFNKELDDILTIFK